VVLAIIAIACGAVLSESQTQLPKQNAHYWPSAVWRTSTPEAQGINSERLADAMDFIRTNRLPIHNLQIVRNGYLVLDAYFYPYNGKTFHDTASVTKSVTSTLIGIALDQKFIRSLQEPVVALFPQRSIANLDSRKRSMTLQNLLTMQSGLACEGPPTEQTLSDMRQTAVWIQFVLDRPMSSDPGQQFVYCSSNLHLLSAVTTKLQTLTTFESS